MMTTELDLRDVSGSDAAHVMVGRYNACGPGDRFDALLRHYDAGIRISLLEGGIRPRARVADDGESWRLEIQRERCPAQGSISGLHHVLAYGASAWTAERGKRVVRVDAASGDIAASTDVLTRASHLGYDIANERVLVADSGSDEVVALRAADLKYIQSWSAPGHPQIPVANSDGVVCVTGSRDRDGTLTIATPRAGSYRTRSITVGAYPHDPIFDHDQKHVFVSCLGSNEVIKARLFDGCIVQRFIVGNGPAHMTLHPDGKRLYTANSWDGSVTCIDTSNGETRTVESGRWAHDLVLTPGGAQLYVANFLDDTVTVFDAELNKVATCNTDAYPHGINISPDGRYVITTGFSSNYIRVFDAASCREAATIEVGLGGSHSAFFQNSSTDIAYVGCSVSDHLAMVDLSRGRCLKRIRLDKRKFH